MGDFLLNLLENNLEELEGDIWPEPNYTSNVVLSCHSLRKIPLKNLSVGNLRLLINQKIGLPYIVPLAIDFLEDNPWCGELYRGDLLCAVLQIDKSYWREKQDLYYRLSEVMCIFESDIYLAVKQILPKWKQQ